MCHKVYIMLDDYVAERMMLVSPVVKTKSSRVPVTVPRYDVKKPRMEIQSI